MHPPSPFTLPPERSHRLQHWWSYSATCPFLLLIVLLIVQRGRTAGIDDRHVALAVLVSQGETEVLMGLACVEPSPGVYTVVAAGHVPPPSREANARGSKSSRRNTGAYGGQQSRLLDTSEEGSEGGAGHAQCRKSAQTHGGRWRQDKRGGDNRRFTVGRKFIAF